MQAIYVSEEFWTKETGFKSPPERFNNPEISDAHLSYGNFLDQTFQEIGGNEEETSAQVNAPTERLYSRVIYGDSTENSTASATQATETSTLTTVSDEIPAQKNVYQAIIEIKEGNNEDRNTFLDEMRKINEDSKVRVQRLEKAPEKNDEIIKALYEIISKKRTISSTTKKDLTRLVKSTPLQLPR